jgi:hypothetical protein
MTCAFDELLSQSSVCLLETGTAVGFLP